MGVKLKELFTEFNSIILLNIFRKVNFQVFTDLIKAHFIDNFINIFSMFIFPFYSLNQVCYSNLKFLGKNSGSSLTQLF